MATRFLKAQNGGIYRDSTGKPIVVDMSLPALSNPATAEDIASGKEAYGADGAVITGTAESVPNKLALVVGTQSADNLYDITAADLDGVTEIKGYTFGQCKGLRSITLPTICTSVPTLSNTNAFDSINGICKIIVPDSLYDEWIAASNWSTYANYIYKASEVA